MKALLVGATGATGSDLLQILLADENIERVDIFVRHDPDWKHEKLTTHKINFDQPDEWKELVKGDVLFSCLGTTIKISGSKEAQWKVDYGYKYSFAQIARQNNVRQCILLSSQFASPKSSNFYLKMKGELENAVKALGFLNCIIFRPPLLLRKNSDRIGEVIAAKLIFLLNKVGLFRSQKPISTKLLALAMCKSATTLKDGLHIINGQKILHNF